MFYYWNRTMFDASAFILCFITTSLFGAHWSRGAQQVKWKTVWNKTKSRDLKRYLDRILKISYLVNLIFGVITCTVNSKFCPLLVCKLVKCYNWNCHGVKISKKRFWYNKHFLKVPIIKLSVNLWVIVCTRDNVCTSFFKSVIFHYFAKP